MSAQPIALALEPSGRFLYVNSVNAKRVFGFEIKESDGTLRALDGGGGIPTPVPSGSGSEPGSAAGPASGGASSPDSSDSSASGAASILGGCGAGIEPPTRSSPSSRTTGRSLVATSDESASP